VALLYADENFRYPVVEELRELGHDVLTSQEAGRAGHGIDDEVVLDDAHSVSRILLTQNRDDFKKLHRSGLPHRGIVVCTYDRDAKALSQRTSKRELDVCFALLNSMRARRIEGAEVDSIRLILFLTARDGNLVPVESKRFELKQSVICD
jgi:Domain of unknown function (DUF5615)